MASNDMWYTRKEDAKRKKRDEGKDFTDKYTLPTERLKKRERS